MMIDWVGEWNSKVSILSAMDIAEDEFHQRSNIWLTNETLCVQKECNKVKRLLRK